jgi:uncharacterized protein (DUF2267 family)
MPHRAPLASSPIVNCPVSAMAAFRLPVDAARPAVPIPVPGRRVRLAACPGPGLGAPGDTGLFAPIGLAEVTPGHGHGPQAQDTGGKPVKGAVVMDQKELARTVAERTRLSRQESADIARAVVEGLAVQLSEGEARRLAADLPGALTEPAQAPQRRRQQSRPVAVDRFIRQVSERTGLTHEDARSGVAAVVAALREALGDEQYRHLIAQLPVGYARLVETPG